MKFWFTGKSGAILVYFAILLFVIGGLGWMTAALLRMEREQHIAASQANLADTIQVALWRLDNLVTPLLARESSRPYSQYSAVFAPSLALQNNGSIWQPGTVLEPSPLLNVELPPWILLHFQTGDGTRWSSPQVISDALTTRLTSAQINVALTNITLSKVHWLQEMDRRSSPSELLAEIEKRSRFPSIKEDVVLTSPRNQDTEQQGGRGLSMNNEFNKRVQQQTLNQNYVPQTSQSDDLQVIEGNTQGNGENYFWNRAQKSMTAKPGVVTVGPMVPSWIQSKGEHDLLVLARQVDLEKRKVCQGVLLDAPVLQKLFQEEVKDLFPDVKLLPVIDMVSSHAERTMTTLPFQLDPGVTLSVDTSLGWTPLRSGLMLTWISTIAALLAMGIGGWSLLNLSERRIRFVSAVTHELRSPLTTLRLYSDMLVTGMVKEEERKTEYLQTMNDEADRLSRLIGNVLAYSRLEKQGHQVELAAVNIRQLLVEVKKTWESRCRSAGKEIVLENQLAEDATWKTDPELVQQILGNLIENACKYSKDAEDHRIILRAGQDGKGLLLEVEDHGQGISFTDRPYIFNAFYRGNGDKNTTGGVGLGLALAKHWAELLGGKLTLCESPATGARFNVSFPIRRD